MIQKYLPKKIEHKFLFLVRQKCGGASSTIIIDEGNLGGTVISENSVLGSNKVPEGRYFFLSPNNIPEGRYSVLSSSFLSSFNVDGKKYRVYSRNTETATIITSHKLHEIMESNANMKLD